MNHRTPLIAACSLIAALVLSTQALAVPPSGHTHFCNNEGSCPQTYERPNARIVLQDHWQLLNDVNTHVNRTIRPLTDWENHGKTEWWTYPTNGAGDCEDFALEKQRVLTAHGIPASALMIAIVHTHNGEEHAVLLVATDRGRVVLDVLEPRILRVYETSYLWLSRQSQTSPRVWVVEAGWGEAK